MSKLRRNRSFVRRALARNWRLAGMVAAAGVLLTLLAIKWLPQEYSSEARLNVQFAESSVDDAARQDQIQALVERLTGRAQADGLAGQQDVAIQSPRGSNVINVECRAASPAAAQKLASRLVEICRAESAQAQPVPQADNEHRAIAEEAERAKAQWEAAEAKLAQAKNEQGPERTAGQRRQLQDEMAAIDAKLLENRSEFKASEAQIASLEKLIASLPETVPTPAAPAASTTPDNTSEALSQLEARERELAATRGDDHPQLVAVRRQIADLRNAPHSQPPQATPAPPVVNPSRLALEQGLETERSHAAAVRERVQELTGTAAKLKTDLEQLGAQAAPLSELHQAADQAPRAYQAAASKLEKMQQEHASKDPPIATLMVHQPPTLPTQPVGPPPAIVLALGVVLSVWSGVISALLAAWFQPVLAACGDLERLWDLPLVGVVPRVEVGAAGAS